MKEENKNQKGKLKFIFKRNPKKAIYKNVSTKNKNDRKNMFFLG